MGRGPSSLKGLDTSDVALRPFKERDRQACLAIFRSNVPDFLGEHEEREFVAFLDERPGPYFVIANASGEVIACGGIAPAAKTGVGILCWGLVHRACHGRRLGELLLHKRLEQLVENGFAQVAIETSPRASGFFARYGFAITRIEPDGFGPGLDRVEMLVSADDLKRSCAFAKDECDAQALG